MIPTENTEKLGRLLKNMHFAMLSSLDEKGRIHSRPMAAQQREFDGELWFFTSKASHKVDELKAHPQVNISYAEPAQNRYVSVSGTAECVDDRAKAAELWNPLFKAWFPRGLDDPNLTLLRIQVEAAEFWDSPSSTMVQLVGFAKAVFTGEPYQPSESEHQHVNFRERTG